MSRMIVGFLFPLFSVITGFLLADPVLSIKSDDQPLPIELCGASGDGKDGEKGGSGGGAGCGA